MLLSLAGLEYEYDGGLENISLFLDWSNRNQTQLSLREGFIGIQVAVSSTGGNPQSGCQTLVDQVVRYAMRGFSRGRLTDYAEGQYDKNENSKHEYCLFQDLLLSVWLILFCSPA